MVFTELRKLCNLFADGDWIESKDQSEDGIRLLQTGNVGEGCFLGKDNRARYISEETFHKLGCQEVHEGDVLISRLPDPIGRACVVPRMNTRLITAVDCSILRFDKSIIPEFFVAYTQSLSYLSQIACYVTGTTRKRISRQNLGKIKVPVPSLSEQEDIVHKIFSIDQMLSNRKKVLDGLDNLIKSQFVNDPSTTGSAQC